MAEKMSWEHALEISQLCDCCEGVPAMQIYYLCDHYEGALALRPEREEDMEQTGCWDPPIQTEGPRDSQESRENGN